MTNIQMLKRCYVMHGRIGSATKLSAVEIYKRLLSERPTFKPNRLP